MTANKKSLILRSACGTVVLCVFFDMILDFSRTVPPHIKFYIFDEANLLRLAAWIAACCAGILIKGRPDVDRDIKAASKALYRQLELVESNLAAAAYREVHSPPFKMGVAAKQHCAHRDLLAEYQWIRDEI